MTKWDLFQQYNVDLTFKFINISHIEEQVILFQYLKKII